MSAGVHALSLHVGAIRVLDELVLAQHSQDVRYGSPARTHAAQFHVMVSSSPSTGSTPAVAEDSLKAMEAGAQGYLLPLLEVAVHHKARYAVGYAGVGVESQVTLRRMRIECNHRTVHALKSFYEDAELAAAEDTQPVQEPTPRSHAMLLQEAKRREAATPTHHSMLWHLLQHTTAS